MSGLIDQSPESLVRLLGSLGLRRAWLVRDPETGRYRASHPRLAELAGFLAADGSDCRGHEAVFLEAARRSGTLFAAFLHQTRRGQAQGGLRHGPYPRLEDLLRDGLRLSLGMTRKNAAAGLWWGGGKGIAARPPGDRPLDPERRRLLFREYGEFVSSLRGCYVTAEDAGTAPPDMAEVFRATRYLTCAPPEVGGSGNPSQMTAAGVLCAMEAALEFQGRGELAGKRVVLEGTGNVGSALIALLLQRGVAGIAASEISGERRAALEACFAGLPVEVHLVHPGDHQILGEPCDVLAPCALGGVLGPKTIPLLQAELVCGAANNQLVDDERDARALAERGITYVPDYIANRMGIVYCCNEQYGTLPQDPAIQRHLDRDWREGIFRTTLEILERARAEGTTPVAAANRLADARALEPHPLFGHRARLIIDSLVASRWEES
jgi:glutamate dehydrogenase/leucine dehydrogenase